MPFVRVSRDKRGYDHFFLVQPVGARDRTRQQVLYWFRTPPNVRVGREPFDEAVRRALETQYPGIAFDWEQLRHTPVPAPLPEYWRERRRAEKAARRLSRADGPEEPAEAGEPGENAEPETAAEPAERAEPPESASAAPGDQAGRLPLPAKAGHRRRRRRGGGRQHMRQEGTTGAQAPAESQFPPSTRSEAAAAEAPAAEGVGKAQPPPGDPAES